MINKGKLFIQGIEMIPIDSKILNGPIRNISFNDAKRIYTNRFTMEHIPTWAFNRAPNGKYFGPHYRSDKEWYDNTVFPGEKDIPETSKGHRSERQTYPLGDFLDKPYTLAMNPNAKSVAFEESIEPVYESETPSVAQLIRKEIKSKLPTLKFTLRTQKNSVRLGVIDQSPSVIATLKEITDKYKAGNFDGMTDMYVYGEKKSHPTVQYIFIDNDISAEMREKLLNYYETHYDLNVPPILIPAIHYRIFTGEEPGAEDFWQSNFSESYEFKKLEDYETKKDEDTIERKVERLMNIADEKLLNGEVTQSQYNKYVKALDAWAKRNTK